MKKVQVQWTECRDLTPDTHWSLSLDGDGTTVKTGSTCLTMFDDTLVLDACDHSDKNQTWFFDSVPRDNALDIIYS